MFFLEIATQTEKKWLRGIFLLETSTIEYIN